MNKRKGGGGCYAENGPQNIFWTKVTKGEMGKEFKDFVIDIKNLPDGQLFRHNVSGDLYGDGVNINISKLLQLVVASKGKKGYTYTHYTNSERNIKAVAFANKNGFTINLSANSISHANELVGKGSPVVCVVPLEYQRRYLKGGEWLETENEYKIRMSLKPMKVAKGNVIQICPATYKDNVSCDTCRLCQKSNRSSIIAFPSHGTNKKLADKIANS